MMCFAEFRVSFDQQTAPPSVHYGNVVCDGSESSFEQCQLSSVSQPIHSSDVYIACLPNQENYSGKFREQCVAILDLLSIQELYLHISVSQLVS